MKYRSLFGLSLEHTYYADGRCPDFAVQPVAKTERVLKNYRAVLKEGGAGVEVLVPLDRSGGPFIELGEDTVFVFSLRLVNAAFPTFTDLSALDGLAAPVFSNAAGGAGSHELSPVARDRFPKLPPGVFALVEIRHESRPGALPAEPVRYRVRFAARNGHWSYYCVTDLPRESNDLTIIDLGDDAPESPLLFGTANRTELGTSPDPADRVASQLAERFPDLRRVRFVSDRAVTCHDAPRKRLELQLNGQRLMGPLPNPPWPDSTVLSAAQGERQAFYHVVKRLTRPLTKTGG